MNAILKYLAALICAAFLSSLSSAYADYDPINGTYTGCATYQRADGSWSKNYKVKGRIVKGADLITFAQQKGYSTKYSNDSYYYVITWKNGGYSALALGNTNSMPNSNIPVSLRNGLNKPFLLFWAKISLSAFFVTKAHD